MAEPLGIKIDDGVPIPEGHGATRYPFKELKDGQSFFVAGDPSIRHKVATSARAYQKSLNVRFSVRVTTENGVTGIRVWRVRAL